MKYSEFLLACFLSACWVLPAGAARVVKEKKMPSEFASFRLEPGKFECELPKKWAQRRDAREDSRSKVYGIYLAAPKINGEPPAMISVQYFSQGNTQFVDARDYMKVQTGKPQAFQLAGKKAKQFLRGTSMSLPPNSLQAKEYQFQEEQIVLEQGGGFYVLAYLAPRKTFLKQRPVFRRVLGTFKLLP